MSQIKFSLSCNDYKECINSKLSFLQQRGEFVDMTIAADGHFVKVHQIIMAIASPYIKELITSASCPHPVVYLGKISHKTLSNILEYIYTGEVSVDVDDIHDFIQVGKELHINGLGKMEMSTESASQEQTEATNTTENYVTCNEDNMTVTDDRERVVCDTADDREEDTSDVGDVGGEKQNYEETSCTQNISIDANNTCENIKDDGQISNLKDFGSLQYTVTTHGRVQLVLNRFLYHLNHVNVSNSKHWRCVENKTLYKCPAFVYTKGEVIVRRVGAHNHTFHDKKILDKVRLGLVFSTLKMAEKRGKQKLIEYANVTKKKDY